MKIYFKISVLLYLLISFSLKAQNDFIISNVNVVNTENANILKNAYVVIDNDLISFVGKRKPSLSEKLYKNIDGKGKFLIPGLIDSHVHMANLAGIKSRSKHPDLVNKYYDQVGKSFLYFGYTSVIDLNNYAPQIINQIASQKFAPEIYTCSEQLTLANGFHMSQEPEGTRLYDYANFLHDSHNPGILPQDIDLAEHTPSATVKKIVEDKGICVKVLYENGFGGTEKVTWEMPSLKIIQEVVSESKRYNIPVLMHASSFEAQTFALDAGVDVIAHGMFHWGDLMDFLYIDKLPESHRKLMEKIAQKQVGYQPTFRVIGGQRDLYKDFLDDPNFKHVMPKELIDWLRTDEGQWQKKFLDKLVMNMMGEKSKKEMEALFQLIVDKITISSNVLAKNNARFLFGSDTPAMGSYTNPPGYNGYLEMQEWQKAGISLSEILKAATINNAIEFHLDHLYGTVEKGKRANLLLLTKNPLEEIEAYNAIEKVILNGEVIERKVLSALN